MGAIFSKEAKIGLATIISLALLYFGVNYLKGIKLFKPVNYYYVSCTNVRDITISSPVYIEGFKVGLVRSIDYDYDSTEHITVEISMDKGMKINKGSYISIESTLLSGAALHIKLNKYVSEYLKPGDTMEGRMKTDIMSSVENDILPSIVDLIPKIDSILIGLNNLIQNPALSQSLTNLEKTTKQLETSSIQLNALLKNDIPIIASNLKTATSNLSTFSDDLRQLDLNPSITTLNEALENIRNLSQKLNAEDSSLGLLMNDTLLYNTLNKTLENASELLIDVKKNPKRYVKLSLF